jgi:hypothetical protein
MPYKPTFDHTAVVAAVRSRFVKEELSATECVQVCAEVARKLQALGEDDVGLLSKETGNRGCFEGECYSVDYVIYKSDGRHFDILISSGFDDGTNKGDGPASASWQDRGYTDPGRWRAVTDVIPPPPARGDVEEPPPPEPQFQCPQWTPVNLEESHRLAEKWEAMYMNEREGNPNHVPPSITDVQLWYWRLWVELWKVEDIEAEIRKPNSTAGKNTFCQVLPK